jgi:hypothetical protein
MSIYGPQAGCLHYHDGENGSGSGARRFALCDDDDIANDAALCLGHHIWHTPAELARESGRMLLDASLLQGSHCGSNHTGDNGGSRRYALPNDDNDNNATDDALHLGCPVWHVPAELARDSDGTFLGAFLLLRVTLW